jgi:ring-1,2-phenylacetyl-CoA epoxidase subunit PaaC
MEAGLSHMWRFVDEMFEEHPDLRPGWDRQVADVLAEATLRRPQDSFQRGGGRNGFHTEHLGHLLAEMQWVARAYPGAAW